MPLSPAESYEVQKHLRQRVHRRLRSKTWSMTWASRCTNAKMSSLDANFGNASRVHTCGGRAQPVTVGAAPERPGLMRRPARSGRGLEAVEQQDAVAGRVGIGIARISDAIAIAIGATTGRVRVVRTVIELVGDAVAIVVASDVVRRARKGRIDADIRASIACIGDGGRVSNRREAIDAKQLIAAGKQDQHAEPPHRLQDTTVSSAVSRAT